jgi:hypothetical protein
MQSAEEMPIGSTAPACNAGRPDGRRGHVRESRVFGWRFAYVTAPAVCAPLRGAPSNRCSVTRAVMVSAAFAASAFIVRQSRLQRDT